ncbi:hypothetical protein F5972_23890 [Microbispora cellulosiformans]|uniref:Uncharacterized protein n=1 Tax=Microbispora cellulosiformans TaxID=2614688 RepID=A0A5J5JZ54_9ACTN|nr:hypothetical protein [Microbispora cellulosiformans]KAA9376456.1 hypothetical protein F5972_23890 [Microbispora cellulosiformans]
MTAPEIAECRADMAAAATAARDILDALGAVPPMFGDHTWQGTAADLWAADWLARKVQLTTLLDAVLTEQSHLVARAEEAERLRAAS